MTGDKSFQVVSLEHANVLQQQIQSITEFKKILEILLFDAIIAFAIILNFFKDFQLYAFYYLNSDSEILIIDERRHYPSIEVR